MALNNNFYSDIFEKEKYWSNLINMGLVNIYYLNGSSGLRDYYLMIKGNLIEEYNQTNNIIIKNILDIINRILIQINILTEEYKKGNLIDVKTLIPLFLNNQMNNDIENKKESAKIAKIQTEREILKSLRHKYTNENIDNPEDDAIVEKSM